MDCQNCGAPVDEGWTLCVACELRFAGMLLRLARDVTPLHDSLDATLHPGGHAPVRIQTATPPTPIRLDVLDLIDMLDATARELWRCLDGIDALDWHKDPRMEDLEATLIACAGHPKLATFHDAGLYMHIINNLARKVDLALDPPEQRREIGTCELCETMLTAGAADQWVTCPVCGREQRAQTVKLRRLKTLCWDDSRRGSAAEIAKAFTDAGITVRRGTLNVWVNRGKLPSSPQGLAYCDVYRLVIGGAA
ncbi:hypothetical protein ACCI46_00305 [Bifidobacterium longum]|jgi:hypothetical protein|uniref:hypothetical protein n=1 Tax=Bifidobacterium longum TaxID=216816 RepID=UPI00165296A3|nr:hypothetical protein [Bifidobacterium longum]MBV3121488.1 hypothetical protein [Bifidobacterium longum]UYJ09058.1 MAG: hypothetical protein OGM57_00445 [Bifidobacteriaceae bacterium]